MHDAQRVARCYRVAVTHAERADRADAARHARTRIPTSTPRTVDPVYGSPVSDHDDLIKRARAAVSKEARARKAWDDAQIERDQAIAAVEETRPDEVSQNEAARRIGLNPSTYRAITNDVRKAKRRARGR